MANNPAGIKMGAASAGSALSLEVVPFKGGRSSGAGGGIWREWLLLATLKEISPADTAVLSIPVL